MKRRGTFDVINHDDDIDDETSYIKDYAIMVAFLAENDPNSVWYRAFMNAFLPVRVGDMLPDVLRLCKSNNPSKFAALTFIKHYNGFKKALPPIQPPKLSSPGSPSY